MSLISIALCFDENYLRPACVTIQSVLETAENPKALQFWVLTPGISGLQASPLVTLVESAGAKLVLVDCTREHERMRSAHTERHLSTAAYYRLFLPELLPPTIGRVVYLDCDLLVRTSIEPLFRIDLGPYAVGAVVNPLNSTYRALDLTRAEDYFNSGVLVLDLNRLRETGEHLRAAEFAHRHPEKVPALDQDALNQILAGRWCRLDIRWNQQSKFFRYSAVKLSISTTELERARRSPYIIHFTSKSKPWDYKDCHPLRSTWFETLDRTLYAGWRPRPKNLQSRLQRIWLNILPFSLHADHLRNEYRSSYHELRDRCRRLFKMSARTR